MEHLFLHYLDGEHAQLLGLRTALSLADRELKRLALLGARISVGDIMLVDSPVMQRLAADKGFRELCSLC